MLPSLYIPPFLLFGTIIIQPFGLLVVLALVLLYSLGRRRARVTGLDPRIFADGQVWIVVSGFVVAHWVSMIFYFPDKLVREPWKLLFVWEELSSFGGFIGASLGAIYFFRRRQVSILKHCDAIIFGFIPAWMVGRMGCTIVFDHPGRPTDFFMGMLHHSDNIVRHNLGLYEMLLSILLTVVLYALKNVRPFDGFHPALMLLLYSPARFLLDYLRETPAHKGDTHYFGLNPGQYFAVGMTLVGCVIIARGIAARRTAGADPAETAAGK